MSRSKMPRHFFTLTVLLCLAFSGRAQETSIETARQIAATTNDNATTLVERQEALKRLEESARLFLTAGEKIEAARVLNRVGHLHLILSSPENAITSHNQALDLLKEAPAVEVEVDNLNGLAAAYRLADTSRVETILTRSITLSEQSGYVRGKAQALLTLSDLQNDSNHALAVQTAQAALALWQTLGDKQGMARAYEQVGISYMAQNILPEATQSYEQALQLWRDLNNPPAQAGALINLGFINYRKAEWQNSISLYTQAQSLIDEDAEPEKMGQIAAGIAEVYNEHGLPEDAVRHFERALAYYRQTQKPELIWYGTWALGWTYFLKQDYSEALKFLDQSLIGVPNDSPRAAASYEQIGQIRLATGDYAAAREALQFALDRYQRAVNPMEAARVQGLLGQVLEYQGQFVSAQQNYVRSVETFNKLARPVEGAAIYYALGRLQLKRGKFDEAEDYLSRSIEMTEKLNRISSSRDLDLAFSASVHDRYQTYIECLMNKHRLEPNKGYDIRALEISESARARSLADFLRATQSNFAPGLDSELAQREKSLRQTLRQRSEYRSGLLNTTYNTQEMNALNAEISRLEAEYNQVTAVINERYPAYKQITQPVAWNLQRIQDEVIGDNETALLEYSVGPEKSFAWVVTRNSIKTFELPGKTEIDSAARKVYDLLSLPPASDNDSKLNAASQELSRMVLSPVAAELDKRVVIVVPDETLNFIPFQILPLSPGTEPMVAKLEVVNAPSGSILGDIRKEVAQRQPATKVLAAFGDPIFPANYAERKNEEGTDQVIAMQQPGMGRWRSALRDIELNGDAFDPSVITPLFYATRELNNLRELAGKEALVVSDFAATRERLLSTDLTQYAMLHLATHGFLDPKRPEFSGLVLSTVNREGQQIDGFVGLQEIYELRAPVRMVVLSACQTALGKDVRGEGLVGLTRGFMYAGASSVVASLWKVDDAATAELMKLFYSNMLQHGMKPAEALRAAQNSIRQRPEWRSPHYWAAFTLQGEYNQVITTTPQLSRGVSLTILIIGGLVVLGIAVAVWWYRRQTRPSAI
ncbi:MAG TPA: CHAT domain-containing tetratricopeptide repeat protein [Pyrinomonadaceae bacterium]|nr:CHAT domain-containing tetratricopeptide repeat protein [Pyrinomonadaceae bacterium]